MASTVLRLVSLVAALSGTTVLRAAISVERSVGDARIERVDHLGSSDLVILDSGFEAGLRQGMVCTVKRDSVWIGELLLVDLRPRVASALILDLVSNESFQSGDSVIAKTVSSKK
jgi:hypothetical protein